jgi:CBS domain-containing protein
MKTAEELLHEKGNEIFSVSPETSVEEVLRLMIDKHIASIVVKRDDKIIGIWSDRDLMKDCLSPDFHPSTAKIGDYMSTTIATAPYTDTVYQLADKFTGRRVRHLLIIKDNAYIGILSVGDVLVNALREKDEELKKLNATASWDYYEDWQRWKKKKKQGK